MKSPKGDFISLQILIYELKIKNIMKKFLLLIFGVFSFLSVNAQVYFDNLSEDLEIGLGYTKMPGQLILSTLQKNGKKKNQGIHFYKADGSEYFPITQKNFSSPTEFIELDRYLETDYFISRFDLMKLYQAIKPTDFIIINGQKFSATVFIAIIKYLDQVYSRPTFRFKLPVNERFIHLG